MSLRVAVMILAALVNTQTDSFPTGCVLFAQPTELKEPSDVF